MNWKSSGAPRDCGKLMLLALLLAGATPAAAGPYETVDYYVQQMIAQAAANDEASVSTFREQMENLRRPESGDSAQARPFHQRGQQQLGRGELKEALAAFRQAFITDPADPEIAAALGSTYLRLHRLKEAERLLVYALSLAPARAATWLQLGQVYGQGGDSHRAAGAFANALRFTQNPPQLIEQLRQLATTDAADAVRIGALHALRSARPAAANPAPTAAAPAAPSRAPEAKAVDVPAVPTTTAASAAPPDPVPDDGNPAQRIYRRGVSLTCLIVTFQDGKTANLGSGLLVSVDGLVITNNHVVEQAENLAVKCGGRESVAHIHRRSKEPDLALLSTSLKTPESFALNETYSRDLIGLDVFVIGNPYGLEGTFSTGVISGLRQIDGVRYIQISAPISPGNSGGPVILRDGTVIGIATMRLKAGQNLNFAIAAADVIASGIFDPSRMNIRSLGPSTGR